MVQKPADGSEVNSHATPPFSCEFLVGMDPRDDTPFTKVTGMHAFRHTLLTLASNTVPRVDAGPLTGHVSDTNATQRGYEAELSLTNKQRRLEGIDFGFAIESMGQASL